MPSIGPLELVVLLIIALVVFGPKRLPELGSSLGRGIREFRTSVSGSGDDDKERPSLNESQRQRAEAEAIDGEIVHDRRG